MLVNEVVDVGSHLLDGPPSAFADAGARAVHCLDGFEKAEAVEGSGWDVLLDDEE
jgi:hypothetical protein